MQLSVVIPVRNEAENILPLLAEIHAALEGKGEFEVIYVDDGSIDATPARLVEALKLHRWLRVLAHAESCGQSAALVTGFRAARGEWIATL
ncbi:MAG: glycosyltransferase family 2 protein, partial [Betaproteobacteria bacterium]